MQKSTVLYIEREVNNMEKLFSKITAGAFAVVAATLAYDVFNGSGLQSKLKELFSKAKKAE